MKKKIILTSVFALLAILVFPVRYSLKDGGSVQYRSFTYEITKVHLLIPEEVNKKMIWSRLTLMGLSLRY